MAFDPSIILAQKMYSGPNPNETMQTLSSLMHQSAQRQHVQGQLAELARKQNQEAQLANIFRTAGGGGGLASALMQGGFGKEALEVQNQQAEIGSRQATASKLMAEQIEKGKEYVRNMLANVKDDAGYQSALQSVPAQVRQFLPPTYDESWAKPFVDAGVPIADRFKTDAAAKAAATQRAWQSKENEKRDRAAQGRADTIATGKAAGNELQEVYQWNSRVEGKGIKKGMDAFAKIDQVAAKYGGISKVPGVGIGAGSLPNASLPKDAQLFRQQGSSLISAYRNKLFGASLSDNEREDFKRIANLGGDATASEVANALDILRRGLISDAQESLAGAPPRVKEKIFKDLGVPYVNPESMDAAADWLKENPDHPKAAEVRELLKAETGGDITL